MPRRDTRVAIIDAAVAVLGRDGPDGFSASALAREAGVSKATIFHHFRSVNDIPVAAFQRMVGETLRGGAGVETSLAGVLSRIGAENLALMRTRTDFLRAFKVFVARAMFDARLAAELRHVIGDLFASMQASMRPFMRDDGDAAAMARLTGAVLDGLALHMLSMGDDAGIDAAWALFVRLARDHRQTETPEESR